MHGDVGRLSSMSFVIFADEICIGIFLTVITSNTVAWNELEQTTIHYSVLLEIAREQSQQYQSRWNV